MNQLEVLNLIQQINKEDVLPKYSLRRNSKYYSFVMYINSSVACYLSENYDGTMIFY
ncbi:hypothetical protein [Aquibacillus albus]|uniref:Uncharacterized protein n=1 Tax=Aquibacillus albus TaxID=1168171 RepID=A0ABS2N2J8_9BACI|nr:hypothetical protein [Aquibacillus albus]MBM7572383.1 hypothetical protein [Aquibacillus albus]